MGEAVVRDKTMSDDEVYAAVADYFTSSGHDLDALLQRLARKDEMTPRQVSGYWRKLIVDFRSGKKPQHVNLYIHIPFCRHHCAYCGYFTLTPEGGGAASVSRYLEVLASQARFFGDIMGKTKIKNLFVGGGTPSFMNVEQLKFFLDNVLGHFQYVKSGQRTIECDPFSMTAAKVKVLKGSVIKRVSMGVESLNNNVLDVLGRTNRDIGFATSLSTVRMLKENDFAKDLNCDLILGLIDETPESFLDSFRGLLGEGVAKIIVYGLKAIPAYLDKFYGGNAEKFQRHYEKMVAAVEPRMREIGEEFGYVCHSNSSYVWYFIERGDIKGSPLLRYEDDSSILPLSVLGLGSSARSRVDGYARYAQAHRLLDRFDPDDKIYLGQSADKQVEMVRTILTSLRNKWQVSLSKFRTKFDCDLTDEFHCVVEDLKKRGKADIEDGALKLTTREPLETMLVGMRFIGRSDIEAAFPDILAGRPVAGDGSRSAVLSKKRSRPQGDAAWSETVKSLVFHLGKGTALKREELRRELRKAYEDDCRALQFLGGDPSERSFLIDGIRYAREWGYRDIFICFDGKKWADRSYLEKIIAAGANRFGVVLHGDAAGLECLKTLRAEGRFKNPVSLHFVITKSNLESLEEYVLRYKKEGVEDFKFHYPSPQFGIVSKKDVPSYKEAMPILLRLMSLNENKWKLRISFCGIPPCVLRWSGRELSPRMSRHLSSGYLFAPEGWADPDSNHANFFKGRSPADKIKKEYPSQCVRCTYSGICEGVWNTYIDSYGPEELVPVEG